MGRARRAYPQPDKKNMGRIKKFSPLTRDSPPSQARWPVGPTCEPKRASPRPVSLTKTKNMWQFFHIPPSQTAPDQTPHTLCETTTLLLDSLLCAILVFLLHPRRRWPPRNTKAECSSPLTASRLSSTATSTTSLAIARKHSEVHEERRATIGLRLADDSDRHDHSEDRFVRHFHSGSLFLNLEPKFLIFVTLNFWFFDFRPPRPILWI